MNLQLVTSPHVGFWSCIMVHMIRRTLVAVDIFAKYERDLRSWV